MSTYIPFDILVLIIERLSPRSMFRFRSVCKAWKSLIDSSQFIADYGFHHTRSQHLMISYRVRDWLKPEVKIKYVFYVDDDTFPQQKFAPTVPSLGQEATLIGTSHGLFCLIGYFREPDDSFRRQMVVLWNPTIRKSIVVALPKLVHQVFNSVGFGVCPNTNDPKLVKITYTDDYFRNPCQIMVFTLRSGEWRYLCTNKLPRKSIKFTQFQTVVGQFIYWVAHDRTNENGGSHKLIMSFDLSSDEFREVHLPDSLRKGYVTVSRLRESLVLLDYHRNFTTRKQVCDVWMMDHGDLKAFTKLFTINAPYASVRSTVDLRRMANLIAMMNCIIKNNIRCREIRNLEHNPNKHISFPNPSTTLQT